MPDKKKALVLRNFNDAGTGDRFTKGDTPLIDAGAFANYVAAGLIEPAQRPAPAPTRRPASRAAKKSSAKPSPAPTPAPNTVTIPVT